MLTPQEITDKAFVKAVFGGYDMTGVDEFLESVGADYTSLYKENAILKGKLKVLVEKVEEYRSTEDAMRMALLTAQRMGDEITTEANKQKAEMLQNTDMEIKAKLTETAKRIADEEVRLNVAAKETAKFIELSRAIMRKHSDFLTKLETARRTVRPESPPVPAPEPLTVSPSREEQIADAAEIIGNVMERLTGGGNSAASSAASNASAASYDDVDTVIPPVHEDEGDPTRLYINDDMEDSLTPRPKFDFDDLKFGSNFSVEE